MLADEIAQARDDRDAVLEGLVATQDFQIAGIMAREEGYNQMYADADRLRHEAEIEWDEEAAEPKWAAWEAMEAAIEEAYEADEFAHGLLLDVEKNIR